MDENQKSNIILQDFGFTPPGVEFDEAHHTYRLDGVVVPSCTTVLDQKSRPYLAPWAAKEGYNYLMTHWDLKKRYNRLEKQELLYQAKNAYQRIKTDAASSGTDVHSAIQEIICGRWPSGELDPIVTRCLDSFCQWAEQHRIEWLASELMVASRQHQFAGTIDFLAIIDGVLTLGDFKTSTRVHPEYFLQTAGYWLALDESLAPNVPRPQQRLILRMDKNGGEIEAMVVPTDLGNDITTFLSLLQVHRWDQLVKNY